MKIVDAIEKANEFVLVKTGVNCEPGLVRFDKQRNVWVIFYCNSNFFAKELTEGEVIDGGEITVNVDCETGGVSMEERF